MLTYEQVMESLKAMGSESIKNVFRNHGAQEPFYGVKVEDLKKIQKQVKKNYDLSLQLFESGVSDAMYLAGLIADEAQMTKKDLQNWAKLAYWSMLSEYTVAWIASESKFGYELGLEWIESSEEKIATTGWATLSSLVSIKNDNELNINQLRALLLWIGDTIHQAPNRVRYTMNGFVIAVGCYVSELSDLAMEIAQKIGKVQVMMGTAACKVPLASDYIQKVKDRGSIGKKKKMARC
ncbi:MAG: DNA alkylation repair protein [Microscillaceae bacterium]|jgi:3-methyladenine DNA glycosylase AlkD|nr:DNA alkylation repair protein [Microscillaceae bacterium]